MRFRRIILALLVLEVISGLLLKIAGDTEGVALPGTSVAKLAPGILLVRVRMPSAIIRPPKCKVPLLLGVKKRLNYKLLMEVPSLASTGIGSGKAALLTPKANAATTALAVVKETKLAVIDLPFRIATADVRGVAGATAGAKAGLASVQPLPNRQFKDPIVVLATAEPIVTGDQLASHAVPETESGNPVYGKQATTMTTERPTAASNLSYTPAPLADSSAPEPHYRKRRQTGGGKEYEQHREQADDEITRQAFTLIRKLDGTRCVTQAICEIAVEPGLAGGFGPNILDFISNLGYERISPWLPYKKAMDDGIKFGSRSSCREKYRSCPRSTEAVVQQAIDQVSAESA